MTVSQDDFDQLQHDHDVLQKTVDTLLINLLQPALDVPGTLRFGGNVMQLDNSGIQIQAPVASPATTAVYFVPRLGSDPSVVYPRSEMDGYALATQAVAQLVAYRSSSVYSMLQTWTGSASNPQTAMFAVDATTTGSAILSMTSGVGIFALSGAYLELFQQSADPASPVDGDVWYNQTSHTLKARINGATVTLGGSIATLLLTDTAWAAAGDLVYGTGNDTATILPGSSEDKFYLRYLTAGNTPVWQAWLTLSAKSSDFSAAGGNFYEVSATATASMPAASVPGRMIRIINTGSGLVTVSRAGSDTFNGGGTTHSIMPTECFTYTANASGNGWLIS